MKKSPAFMPKVLLAAVSIVAITSCANSVSGDRAVAADGRGIHRSEQLDEFILEKPVEIRGLGTRAALEKLDREYRETCRKAGEVPLDLAYEVPAGYERSLNFRPSGYFEVAVREIAATSKLEWRRHGNTYRFQPPKASRENDRVRQETHLVPPDFLARIGGGPSNWRPGDPRTEPRVVFEKRGVSLDPSTRLSLRGSRFTVETRSRSDEAAISDMVGTMIYDAPRQIQWDVRTFNVPSGQSWDGLEKGIVDDAGLAELRGIPGVQELVICGEPLRSHTPRVGRLAVGTLRSEAVCRAFGIQVKAELNQGNRGGRPVSISVEGQTPDGGTRVASTTRADGSRVVLAVTPTILDATGRPVKKSR
ncbi:MAG: hypothetical protein EOP83_10165 [Verrucomicrobiaceae bacterium]|nr:MAG: hypothetical protein EOP83_10165 [Verrucomicrobiaceae bacterium]